MLIVTNVATIPTPRATSTKTRIKTTILLGVPDYALLILQEQLPQKQGLRPPGLRETLTLFILQEQLPQKQGLRHSPCCLAEAPFNELQEQLPQKQGLRRL